MYVELSGKNAHLKLLSQSRCIFFLMVCGGGSHSVIHTFSMFDLFNQLSFVNCLKYLQSGFFSCCMFHWAIYCRRFRITLFFFSEQKNKTTKSPFSKEENSNYERYSHINDKKYSTFWNEMLIILWWAN